MSATRPTTASHASLRRHRPTLATVLAVLGTCVGLAACGGGGSDPDLEVDLNGKWGDIYTNFNFQLEQTGSTVTGTMRVGTGRTLYYVDGSVSGDRFTFTAGDGCTRFSSASGGVLVVQRTNNADSLEGKLNLVKCNSPAHYAPIDLFVQRQPG